MARATFSLDEATIAEIRRTAARLRKPQSQVVREAVADYAARTDRLSERERGHLMGVLEGLRATRTTGRAMVSGWLAALSRGSARRGRSLTPGCR